MVSTSSKTTHPLTVTSVSKYFNFFLDDFFWYLERPCRFSAQQVDTTANGFVRLNASTNRRHTQHLSLLYIFHIAQLPKRRQSPSLPMDHSADLQSPVAGRHPYLRPVSECATLVPPQLKTNVPKRELARTVMLVRSNVMEPRMGFLAAIANQPRSNVLLPNGRSARPK